jgi:hypothetical protein
MSLSSTSDDSFCERLVVPEPVCRTGVSVPTSQPGTASAAKNRRLCILSRALCAMATASLRLDSQSPREIRLAPPDVRLESEFRWVISARLLTDGRMLITDPRGWGVALLDFRAKTVRTVGRRGAGPLEYGLAGPLLRLGGDSTLMANNMEGRWLLLDGARIVGTVSPHDPAVVATRAFARWADSSGYVYALRSPPRPAGDSLALVRVSRRSGHQDTVAMLRKQPSRFEVDAAGRSSFRSAAFSAGEEAMVFPDGWVAVARLDPYRVDWRTPDGRWIRGPALPWDRMKVDDREKEAFLARRAHGSDRPVEPISAVREWEREIPPFQYDPLVAGADGRLFIRLTETASHPETRYAIVNRSGMLDGRLVLGAYEQLLYVGSGFVYVLETDDDGRQWIRRHGWVKPKAR